MPLGFLIFLTLLALAGCTSFRQALAPVLPSDEVSAGAPLPDTVLMRALRHGELIVLATPVDIASAHGFLTPSFQLGARETWYDVKLVVDSVAKGKLKHARWRDYGFLPAVLTPPPPFGKLAPNEIIVQYPAVTSSRSDWAAAAPLTLGETAVFVFRKCHYCLPITGVAHGRGPYYTASPWVALGSGSRLPPTQWSRVIELLAE